ncbi:MAG TPA: 50S ribosomal protein L1 [Candidatus Dormibacteraeota bacterium]|jgi:large subunit ribosomal protein L1|nr:50S ribosomal protein L1 [Candidatus Dormibacteraeota bacterium]
MPHRYGKKYREVATQVEAHRLYDPQEAVILVRQTSPVKFDATVEAHIRLGVDPRHADQMVRSSALLPHGTGRTRRIAVFAMGDKMREALEAGADIVGGEDLVKKVQAGEIDFDVALATPDIMGQVGRLGKILGPRGMMPNPKSGTVTFDIAKAVRDVQGGRVEFRVDRFGIVHVPVGKVSFDDLKLRENFATLMESIMKAKPAAAKGTYVRTVTLTSTMGPGVGVDPVQAARLTAA